MDQNPKIVDLKKKLQKTQVEIEIINLFGEYGAPVKRKDLEAQKREIEREIEECDSRKDIRTNPYKN